MQKKITQCIYVVTRFQPRLALTATLLFLFSMLGAVAVQAQTPSISSISPTCATVARTFELTINSNGPDFDTRKDANGATVIITGTGFTGEVVLAPKSVTANQIKVDIQGTNTVLANAGTLTIAVRQNPNGTAVTSNGVQMEVYSSATTITGPTSVCVGTAANFTVPVRANAANYTWSVLSGKATITAGGTTSAAEVSFGNVAGTVRIGVAIGQSCGASSISATFDVTVNAAPVVTLAPFANICTDAGVLTLTGGAPAGGEYFVDGVKATITDANGVITSSFDPTTATPGDHEVIYYFTSSNGCTGSAIQTITVIPAPTVTLTLPASVCADAGIITL
ncbi:MAG: C-terminal target protein, partial [Adhaeribacter sp.]|nr:C-terminal target protein [Adhaeribacter sp.]